MFVCLSAFNSGTGLTFASKFSGYLWGAPVIILGTQKLGVVGRGPQNLHK